MVIVEGEGPSSRKRVYRLLISDLGAGLSSGVSLGIGRTPEGNDLFLRSLELDINSLKLSKHSSSGR